MTVTGHEDEFRRLFEREAGHAPRDARRAGDGARGRAEDPELVTEMFRAAHTLKGGAAVVGFDDVAAVVHQLEQLLEELRSGERRPDGALVDGVLAAVDAVREMVGCAMAGADASGAASTALAAIDAARGQAEPGRRRASARLPRCRSFAPRRGGRSGGERIGRGRGNRGGRRRRRSAGGATAGRRASEDGRGRSAGARESPGAAGG